MILLCLCAFEYGAIGEEYGASIGFHAYRSIRGAVCCLSDYTDLLSDLELGNGSDSECQVSARSERYRRPADGDDPRIGVRQYWYDDWYSKWHIESGSNDSCE